MLFRSSSDKIKVIAEVRWGITFLSGVPGHVCRIVVVQDIPGIPIFLMGEDVIKRFRTTISYNNVSVTPTFHVYDPYETEVNVVYAHPSETVLGTAKISLEPDQGQTVTFRLHPGGQLCRMDRILITSFQLDDCNIIPSLSYVEFNSDLNCYEAECYIQNFSSQKQEKIIKKI